MSILFVCLFVYYVLVNLSIYLSIIIVISLLVLFTIIFTNIYIHLYIYMYIYIYIYLFIYLFWIFYLTYANKVRAACIIVSYNDDLKAHFGLSRRGRSCLVFVRSGMFGLDIALKKKLCGLFNPVSIQEEDLYLETWLWSLLICTEKTHCGGEYTG